MAGETDFIWELLSDSWKEYEDRDRISSMWEGFLQVTSDLLLQLMQANESKSIEGIPVFRRYRWKHYPLVQTEVPHDLASAFLFAHSAGDPDVLSVPSLRDLVNDPPDADYSRVADSLTGSLTGGSYLEDTATPFPPGLRVGDFVRCLSGTDLAEVDTNVRFQIVEIESPTRLRMNVLQLVNALAVTYVVERAPRVDLIEGHHYTVGGGTINFLPDSVLNQDGSAVAFRVVEHTEYTANTVRDDPRLIADGGNGVTSGTGDIVTGSPVLVDAAALFLTHPNPDERPVAGDYVVLRPSGVQPTQILTTQLVFRVAVVLSDTQLEFEGLAGQTTSQVAYTVLKPSAEDFDLVSTEQGLPGFSLGYAFVVVAAASPSGTTGELRDDGDPGGDVLQDVGVDFTGLVGRQIRLLSGSGLDPLELRPFTIVEVRNGPAFDTVLLDRKVVAHSTALDATYIVGDLLALDVIYPRPAPSSPILRDVFRFQTEPENTVAVIDGAVFFNQESVPIAGPLVASLRARTALNPGGEAWPARLWAEETVSDQEALYANFGFPIQVRQANSEAYKSVLQGLWYAYWSGPAVDNLVRGLNLVFALPYAGQDGTVANITLPDPAVLIGTVESASNVPPFTFDTSSTNPGGDSRFLAFSVDNLPPVLVIFADTPVNPSATVVGDINTAVGSPVASLDVDGRLVLTATTSVKIDTVIGNPGLGFDAGNEDFGTYHVDLLYADGSTETKVFGTEFPLAVQIGQSVTKFQPLTRAVGIFDYIELPEWWNLFNIPQINPTIESFSQADRDALNDILKDFTFAVRVVADAFTRLGPTDRGIVRFFLEQIKPTISDFLFIVAESIYDLVSVTDDRRLLNFVPAPSASFAAQHAGQTSSQILAIGLKNRRTIEWNRANYDELSPAERAFFEANYTLSMFDDFVLATEDLTVVAPAHIELIDGSAGVSYVPAIINGTVSTHFFDTSTLLSLRWHGVTPLAFPAFSANPLRVDLLMDEINTFSVGVVGSPIVRRNPDGTLQFYSDRLDGTAPQLEVLVANPGLGLVLASVFGTASATGVLQTVDAS